jgi:uncharacterized glyoxalase superfamily protein PhnB
MTREDRNIWPGLTYDDPVAARAWLAAIGFEEGQVVPGADGVAIQHSEMIWPEGGRVMISSHTGDERYDGGTGSCYVVTADPDAVHRRALGIGATVVREPVDTDYGSRDVGLQDQEGRTWHFGTYAGEHD